MENVKRPTIRDVAAAAGVSQTTVSDALSGKGRLSDETRKKVHDAATKLDYQPDAIARGMRGQGLGLVGISIALENEANPSAVWYWISIASHASEAILNAGFALVQLPHNATLLTKLRVPLDGVIVVDPLENDEVIRHFRRKKIELVTIGRDIKRPQGPWLDDDYEGGMTDLLDQTVVPGERISVVTFGLHKSYIADALRGLDSWASASGSPVQQLHCDQLDDHVVDAVLHKTMAWHAQVIVAQNGRIATRLLQRLKALGIRVPEMVRLVSVADSPELQFLSPAITAMQPHPAELGAMATKVLFDRLNGIGTEERKLLPMDIFIRSSAPLCRVPVPD
jgi:DNA-binding LacI/PurR family transcriptional regulator